MTEKIDIAEILKDKPANTKLYSPLFGEVYFSHVGGGNIAVEHHGGISLFFSSGRFFDYDESDGVTFSTEKVGVTDCGTENVPYVNAASLWHDLKEDKPPLRKWVMFRYSGGGVNPTALHYGAMSDDIWLVTRGDGTHRIEALYECYDKIEWLDFDELK